MKLNHKLQRWIGRFIPGERSRIVMRKYRDAHTNEDIGWCFVFRGTSGTIDFDRETVVTDVTKMIPNRRALGMHKWREYDADRYWLECTLCDARCHGEPR